METPTTKKLVKLNLPKSLKRHIREQKSVIKHSILDAKERAKAVGELYKKVLTVKKPTSEKKEKAAKK